MLYRRPLRHFLLQGNNVWTCLHECTAVVHKHPMNRIIQVRLPYCHFRCVLWMFAVELLRHLCVSLWICKWYCDFISQHQQCVRFLCSDVTTTAAVTRVCWKKSEVSSKSDTPIRQSDKQLLLIHYSCLQFRVSQFSGWTSQDCDLSIGILSL
jgi:hypothetical protein